MKFKVFIIFIFSLLLFYPLSEVFAGTNSWTTTWNLSSNSRENRIADIVETDNSQLVAGGSEGMWISTDSGENWVKNETFGNHDVRALSVNPKNQEVVYAGVTSEGVYKSTNNGQSWTQTSLVDKTGSMTYIRSVAVSPHNTKTVFATAHAPSALKESTGIFRSMNGGSTWEKVGMEEKEINELSIHPRTGFIYATVLHEGVYESKNLGRSWQLIFDHPSESTNNFTFTTSFNPSDAHTLYVGAWDGLYVSNNRGKTWEKDSAPWMGNVRSVYVSPNNSEIIYVQLHGSIVKSTNRGSTWDGSKYAIHKQITGGFFIKSLDDNTHKIFANILDGFTSAPIGIWEFTDI